MSGAEESDALETVSRIVAGRWQVFHRRPLGSGPTHGLASTYRSQMYACRCEPCRKANTALQKREDAKRRDRLSADPTLAPHGLVSTYVNWGCRCEPCSAAHSEELKRLQEDRYARLKADPTIREHGTSATYNGWGCRCEKCVEAARVDRQSRQR